jgi:hypothetical protein
MGSVGSILCVAPFGISKYQYGWSSTEMVIGQFFFAAQASPL